MQFKNIDFLDLTFDPGNDFYELFRKKNNNYVCTSKHCNHSQTILKQLLKSTERRYLIRHQTRKHTKILQKVASVMN